MKAESLNKKDDEGCLNEWINAARINEYSLKCEYKINKFMQHEWVNESSVNEGMKCEWRNKVWMNEQMDEGMKCEWVNEWMNDEWMNEWMNAADHRTPCPTHSWHPAAHTVYSSEAVALATLGVGRLIRAGDVAERARLVRLSRRLERTQLVVVVHLSRKVCGMRHRQWTRQVVWHVQFLNMWGCWTNGHVSSVWSGQRRWSECANGWITHIDSLH